MLVVDQIETCYGKSQVLFGVSPTDPLTFGGIFLVLGFVAVVASYLPARRATRSSAHCSG